MGIPGGELSTVSSARGAITWKSKKQSSIALSTMQGEYVALSEAGHEVVGYKTYSKSSDTPNKVLQLLKEIMTAPL